MATKSGQKKKKKKDGRVKPRVDTYINASITPRPITCYSGDLNYA